MNAHKKLWLVLFGSILALVLIACSCGSLSPLALLATPTATLHPTATVPPPTATPLIPMQGLAGYWQDVSRVFTIEWQGDKYVVTNIAASGTSTRTLTEQSWDGQTLTWSYAYTDESGSSTVTYSTLALHGDTLTVNFSSSGGASATHTLYRNSSGQPSYFKLPYADDFSNPNSGWDVFSTDQDAAGYGSGYYFVTSKTDQFSSFGAAGMFFGDVVINVDATPASGPNNGNFSYNIGCRNQPNYDGYIFDISADGYFAVGYYTGGGKDYHSLLTGDQWQESSAIQQGLATNHITLTCASSHLKFEVNSQVLYEGDDPTFFEGDITLGAATYEATIPAEVHFTNFSVTAP